jgi:hypothetical protein
MAVITAKQVLFFQLAFIPGFPAPLRSFPGLIHASHLLGYIAKSTDSRVITEPSALLDNSLGQQIAPVELERAGSSRFFLLLLTIPIFYRQ